MKAKAISFIIFIIILGISFTGVNKVLTYKTIEGDGHWYEFYKEKKDSIDVLFLGSSHVMRQINPAVIFHDTGVSSFNIATGGEAPWSTYWTMKEALKYQKPKVIVVDIYMTRLTQKYYEDTHNISATFGMKRDENWLGSINSGVKSNKSWYMLRYPLYHGRYNELTSKDFMSKDLLYNGLLKGYWVDNNNWIVREQEPMIHKTLDRRTSEWNKKSEKYLLKIIDLADENNIKLLFLQTPGVLTDTEVLLYNNVYRIAQNKGVDYLESNKYMDDIKLDEKSDFRDKDHMNWRGTNKYSSWIGKYLYSKYSLTDHRGVRKFDSWEKDYNTWQQLIADNEIRQTNSISSLMSKLKKDGNTVVVSVGSKAINLDSTVKSDMSKAGVPENIIRNGGICVIRSGKTVFNSESGKEDHFYLDWFSDKLKISSSGEKKVSAKFNGKEIIKTNEGLSVFIYSDFYEQQVDNVGFIAADNFAPIRDK